MLIQKETLVKFRPTSVPGVYVRPGQRSRILTLKVASKESHFPALFAGGFLRKTEPSVH